jgi:ribosomal protein S18 acetylase RimI-like enzyme
MIEIRRLDAEAARLQRDALAEILVDCVAGGASVGFMQPYGLDEAQDWWDGVFRSVGAGETILLAAYVDGDLTGTVQLGLAAMPNQRHRADVKKLLVHSKARRRGLASRLMAALEEEARRLDRFVLVLDTATGSEAEGLYQKLGWTRIGVIPDYARWPEGPFCGTTLFFKSLAA